MAASSLRGTKPSETITAKIYDLLGRLVQQQQLMFKHQEATINLNLANGTYILEVQDEAGNLQRERMVIQ